MAVTYDGLMALQRRGQRISYTTRDTILYALSVGMGRAQVDPVEMPFVYEGGPMKVVPTMATVLSAEPVRDSGLDFRGVLHGEQRLRLYGPLPPQGQLVVDAGVSSILDKGKAKGVIVNFTSTASTEAGKPVFASTTTIFARRDGGIGSSADHPAALPPVPLRKPDITVQEETRKDQALLYRLNGDDNPLHADPEVARQAGFDVPILHGLCSYGIACKAVLNSVAAGQPERMKGFDARFMAPIFPGETIEVEIWKDQSRVAFRARIVERDIVAIDNGLCILAD